MKQRNIFRQVTIFRHLVLISCNYITNFPFLSSIIPTSSDYGVFISQLVRYARACSSYECFIPRAVRLSCKLLGQGYVRERLKSPLRKFYGRYGDFVKDYEVPLSQMLHGMIIYSDTLHWSDVSLNRDLATELDLIIIVDVITLFREVSIGHLQLVRLANRGRILFWTPGPVSFVTCICSTFLKLSCLRTYWVSNIPRYFYFASSFFTETNLFFYTSEVQRSVYPTVCKDWKKTLMESGENIPFPLLSVQRQH